MLKHNSFGYILEKKNKENGWQRCSVLLTEKAIKPLIKQLKSLYPDRKFKYEKQ